MTRKSRSADTSRVGDLAQLVLRVGVGATLFAHGTQKLFGWFGGNGLEATAAGFDRMGFRPGKANALAAGAGEAGGGALLALGALTPAAGAAALGTMVVASSVHAPNGFFSNKGGYEFPAVLGLTATSVALSGPGRYSLDAAMGNVFDRRWMRLLAVAVAAPAAYSVIARRKAAQAADRAAAAEADLAAARSGD
jgi:putative oxidoreductase